MPFPASHPVLVVCFRCCAIVAGDRGVHLSPVVGQTHPDISVASKLWGWSDATGANDRDACACGRHVRRFPRA